VRLSWAKLLKRVFEIDLEHCPNCGGELKIIGVRTVRANFFTGSMRERIARSRRGRGRTSAVRCKWR